MSHTDDEFEDPRLAQLLRAANPLLADAGFSERVLQRVRQPARIRQAVLAAAALSGFALALVPASRLLVTCSEQLVVASVQWSAAVQGQLQRLGLPGPYAPGPRPGTSAGRSTL